MFPQTTHVETVALFEENLKREILIQILRNGYRALNLIKSFSQHRLCILWLKINRDWRLLLCRKLIFHQMESTYLNLWQLN